MTTLRPTRFTAEDADRAYAAWNCNCGPGAIAAVLGMTLDEVRPHMEACGFASKGYTNPTMMLDVLERIGARFRYRSLASNVPRLDWPRYGLARIQWEGPWTKPSVPMRARYRFTHWVGACVPTEGNVGIFDINAIANGSGWTSLADWTGIIVPALTAQYPRADGKWHITHAIEVRL
jgi:hypothetical protein